MHTTKSQVLLHFMAEHKLQEQETCHIYDMQRKSLTQKAIECDIPGEKMKSEKSKNACWMWQSLHYEKETSAWKQRYGFGIQITIK